MGSDSRSGVEIVPMTVLEYNYNSEWVIAKTGNTRKNSKIKYWIIKKAFDNYPIPEVIKSNTLGPLDWDQFSKELTKRKIQLELKKLE